ncbi:hypothetical protein WA026_020212 [Henosepilachna vigintioctopunctata]|uniref:Oligopeptide transporter 1 n=1 Tax=Henosepilachna vigintioctopunctata TaxID=420089 RepID=A0AAW1U4V1_9CUCU
MTSGQMEVTSDRSDKKKFKYPYSVFFIVSNEFCERFCFYGMRSILTLYLVNILFYAKSDATVIYHAFTVMVYFFPLLGAIISDSYLGKFNTIFFVSMIYAVGCIVLSISSIPDLKLPMNVISLIGLFLIAVGSGGIKPCVSAFGGDQFVLPQQEKLLVTFFSLYYAAINAGSLISTFLTPVLREDVHCFGNSSCYPLAFGVPGILMIISIVIFGLGRPLYKIRKPEGNIIVKVVKCMGHAIKSKSESDEKKDHWLDHSVKKFGRTFVDDVKATLRVLVLYTPLPIFWALYDQQGTAWTFQAVRMNGDIGFYTILPDQFQVVNPVLILAFIPLFNYIVYPLFQKVGLMRTSLEKMIWGGFLAAAAFLVSALVSLQIEATDPVLPADGFAQVRFYNPLSCNITIIDTVPCSLKEDLSGVIESMSYNEILDVKLKGLKEKELSFSYEADCMTKKTENAKFTVKNVGTTLVYFTYDGLISAEDDITKDNDSGYPFLRLLTSRSTTDVLIEIELEGDDGTKTFNNTFNGRIKMSTGKYRGKVKSTPLGKPNVLEETTDFEVNLQLGGIYTWMLEVGQKYPVLYNQKLITVTEPNSVSMLWLLPQYIIITAAEILYSITGLEFSYSQAPVTMKSVLTAAFLLTDALGNVIIVIIESSKIFDKASYDFMLYTVLMILDMLVFAYLASRYQYVDFEKNDELLKKLNDENHTIQSKDEMGSENAAFTHNPDI